MSSYKISPAETTAAAIRPHRPRVIVDLEKISGHKRPTLEGREQDEKGEYTTSALFSFDNDWTEWQRRATKIAKVKVSQALKDKTNTEGLYWAQKAGCPCGCSPAFILPNAEKTTEDIVLEEVPEQRTAGRKTKAA